MKTTRCAIAAIAFADVTDIVSFNGGRVVIKPTDDLPKETRKIIAGINKLIKSIEREGTLEGIGKPEPLRYRKGFSRRITD